MYDNFYVKNSLFVFGSA